MSTGIFEERDRSTESDARTGVLSLPHGQVLTPAFMPVGTVGTVKALSPDTVHSIGYRLILANTYHLYLRPGVETIADFDGLHRFMSWPHNILTDSGGYQVFSLAQRRTISTEGVRFRSHLDGSFHDLTPETVVDIQRHLNSDVQMALDVCTGPGVGRPEATEALEITNLWARRARDRWIGHRDSYRGQLFGIVQGNFFADLRRQAAEQLQELDFPGYAIGGLSVGEPFPEFERVLAITAPLLPRDKPRYVMGIGTPEYILSAIEHGIDMFDCVFPTRAGRTGTLFTSRGRINIKNAKYARDPNPPDPEIPSFGGQEYSRAYLRHLFNAGEILGSMLATEHNLRFLAHLVEQARTAIAEDRFLDFKRSIMEVYPA